MEIHDDCIKSEIKYETPCLILLPPVLELGTLDISPRETDNFHPAIIL